ncbi:major facilitator superfamily domain-containing protein [Lipomyces kononenkoae]|uniref:Major facilitator superfamily domain-containing protein n=1 Tax=Lipomyces kononenkoae TaxID=34357 RepID=A0ACC3SSR0_LIPKO
MLGQISATFDLGSFAGCIVACFVGERLGRRKTIILGSSILIVGGVRQAAAFQLAQLIFGRLVAGFGNGLITSTFPVLACLCAWINFCMRFVNSSFGWRFPVGLQCLFAIVGGGMASWLPESPREADHVISLLLRKPIEDTDVQIMKNDIVVNVEHEQEIERNSSWKDLFRNDETQNLRRITLGALTQLFQQVGGIKVINYYMGYIVQNYAGFDRGQSLILAAGNLMNQAFYTSVAFAFIDSFGRKKTLSYSYIGQAFPLRWNADSFGSAVSTATTWLFNYIVVVITPAAASSIGYRYYIIYTVLNIVFAVVCYLFFVETARLSLEEIDQMFAREFHERRGETYETPNEAAFTAKKTPEAIHFENVDEKV